MVNVIIFETTGHRIVETDAHDQFGRILNGHFTHDGVRYTVTGEVRLDGQLFAAARRAVNQPRYHGNCQRCNGTGQYHDKGLCFACGGSGSKSRLTRQVR